MAPTASDQKPAPNQDSQGPAEASPTQGEGGTFPHTMLQCLVFASRLHEVDLTVGRLIHEYALGEQEPELDFLAHIARENGLKTKVQEMDWKDLSSLGQAYPVVAALKNGNGVVVLAAREKDGQRQVALVDPLAKRPGPFMLEYERFAANFSGRVLLLQRHFKLTEEEQPFGFRWFVPELLRQKRLFVDVALAALVLPVIGLASPLFFQLVIDKVLVHHSQATLYVLTAGILLALGFELAFSVLRQYLLLFATRRIDIRLARRTFAHLLSLPLAFFEKRYAGVIAKHMQQTEKIRRFLTGRLFLTLLDSVSLFIFLPVLLLYSAKLTGLVLGFSLLIALVITALIGPFRQRLRQLYTAEGDRQAFLVENIHGMGTVKSLAIEPTQKKNWDRKAALAVEGHFRVGVISAVAQNLTRSLEKFMIVAVIVLGAFDVFDGSLSLGALVAFQMMAGRVTNPLVQIVSLIHEYQETALSIRMLGEVMNARPERSGATAGLRPPIQGAITLEQVTFRYPGAVLPALDNLSLSIAPSTVVGVVGRSGSGKTTLARLLQGLYYASEGIIRVDGVDLRELDLAYFRRNVGVVLQENFLFRGSIRQNIAATKTDASFAEIVAAARMAGADEFIERMPHGYETFLEEGATNLSGGQRQRLAIARALLIRPRILILDEATSALDPESEAIIKANLNHIAKGRTVILISHRLTNLVDADNIIVLEESRLACQGRHGDLLETCPIYERLWRQQVGSILKEDA